MSLQLGMAPGPKRLNAGLLGSLVAALSLGACGGNITNPFGNEGQLTTIAISGDSVVQVGDTIHLSARGKVAGVLGPFSYDRVLDAVWTISDPTIASLTPVALLPGDTTSGSAVVLRGLRTGAVQVTATARGVSGGRSVTVLR